MTAPPSATTCAASSSSVAPEKTCSADSPLDPAVAFLRRVALRLAILASRGLRLQGNDVTVMLVIQAHVYPFVSRPLHVEPQLQIIRRHRRLAIVDRQRTREAANLRASEPRGHLRANVTDAAGAIANIDAVYLRTPCRS